MKLVKKFWALSFKKRVAILSILAILIVIFVLSALSGEGVTETFATKSNLPIYCVQKDSKVLSLTFNVLWEDDNIEYILETLDMYDIRATFFVTGKWLDNHSNTAMKIHENGHELANHSDRYEYYTELSSEQVKEDLLACNEKIEAITGKTPTLFRMPYGEYSDGLVTQVRELGMEVIQWDVDSQDWKEASPEQIAERVSMRSTPGAIVLFHTDAKHIQDGFYQSVEKLIQSGYSFVPISELLLTEQATIDHTGRQIPAQQAAQ